MAFPLTEPLLKVQQLQGVYFEWDTLQYPEIEFEQGRQIGLIAQDVQSVVPEVVGMDAQGFSYIDYNRLVPVLIEAVKDQQTIINGQQLTIDSLTVLVNNLHLQNSDSVQSQIASINAQLAAIQSCIDNLPPGLGCSGSDKMSDSGNNTPINVTQVELKSDEIILDQNNPNPFKETTTINYFIPDYIVFAQIIFSDNTGKIIKTVDINESGYGQLKVKAEKLMSGIYNYSIVVDGKIAETKKMVKN
ncbi:MAG: tail fiber domain-containing protein [Bacteroidia bacterium]|nr:tail fiber domain-containing protein [Bacteroidia bacterium]